MYERFYGLRERAFEMTPDPRFLLLTRGHREALGNVEYGITYARGFTLLLGGAGTGKTTILRKALTLHADGRNTTRESVYVNNPRLTLEELLELVAAGIGLPPGTAHSKSHFLREAEDGLQQLRETGHLTVLIIDEAQSLSDDLLEEIRLLGNMESDTEKLLPVILAGQPEFGARLNEPHLRQLKQRVALRCTLQPLTVGEVAGYVAGRLRLAGGDPGTIFTRDAIVAVARRSQGIPRTINVVCDNALLNGLALERRPVDEELIDEVCADFDLQPAAVANESVEDSPGSSGSEPRGMRDNVRLFVSEPGRSASGEFAESRRRSPQAREWR
jgi:general secretion pathway protein A